MGGKIKRLCAKLPTGVVPPQSARCMDWLQGIFVFAVGKVSTSTWGWTGLDQALSALNTYGK